MTRGLALASVVVALVAAVAAAVTWNRRIDLRQHRAYTQALLHAEDLDARLDAEIARTRLGLVTHFDGLVRLGDARRANLAVLRHPPPHAPLDAEVAALQQASDAKSDRLEAFKTDQAVLRNAARLLPFLADRLTRRLPRDAPLRGATHEAVAAVLGAAADPSDQRWTAARCALVPLGGPDWPGCQAQPLPVPATHQGAVDALVDHATEVVQRQPVVDASVRALGRVPVRERVRDVIVAYDQATQAVRAELAGRTTLVGVLAVLAVVLGALAVIVRMQHTAQALRDATSQLQATNRQLSATNHELKIERDRKVELAQEVASANDELASMNEELARTIDQLADANDLLADEAEQKTQFVSITSHEFRTPLTVIRQSAELLEAYGMRWDETRRGTHLRRILGKSQEMEGMLEQLLVIGRADSGLLELHCSAVVVGALLDEVVSGVRAKRFEDRALHVVDDTGSVPLVLDAALVKRVLTNLLSNALKYSPDDRPVRLCARRAGGEVSFTVIDEGIGIPVADQSSLFRPFQRCRNAADFEGTGLGLAVVQRSVQVHGGRIELDSAEGRGTRFVVHLPAEVAA